MPLRDFLKLFPDFQITKAEFAYCDYLERRGLRFLIHFGIKNAEAMAWGELESQEYEPWIGHA